MVMNYVALFASLLVHPAGCQDSFIKVDELESFLSTNGITITRRVGSTQFEAQTAGGNAVWNVSASSKQNTGLSESSAPVNRIYLSVEFRVRQVLEASKPTYLLGSEKTPPSIKLVSHLGNSTTAFCYIMVGEADTYSDVTKSLKDCLSAVEAYAKKEFGTLSKVDTKNSAIAFDPSQLRFSYPDFDSIDRLITYWKWNTYNEFPGNAAGIIPVIVDGYRAYLGVDPTFPKLESEPYKIWLSRETPGRLDDIESMNRFLSSKYPQTWATGGSPGHVRIYTSIVIGKRFTGRDLRNQILARIQLFKRIESEAR